METLPSATRLQRLEKNHYSYPAGGYEDRDLRLDMTYDIIGFSRLNNKSRTQEHAYWKSKLMPVRGTSDTGRVIGREGHIVLLVIVDSRSSNRCIHALLYHGDFACARNAS